MDFINKTHRIVSKYPMHKYFPISTLTNKYVLKLRNISKKVSVKWKGFVEMFISVCKTKIKTNTKTIQENDCN